jgi:hypothetical protein
MIIPDRDALLDDILARWHGWALGTKVSRGHASRSLVAGDHRGYGLQYESQLEQQDVDLESARCRVVDHQVREMAEPWRTAIYQDAKNVYCGLAVWNSPRLSSDPMCIEIIREEARQLLAVRLVAAGVIECTATA